MSSTNFIAVILQTLNVIVVVIGIPTLVKMLIDIGGKLKVLETLDEKMRVSIEPDLKDARERFAIVEDRVQTIWQDKFAPSHFPRQLNDVGAKILEESGIREIIASKKQNLLRVIKNSNPQNAYDAEQVILSAVADLPKYCPDVLDSLKEGAFRVGQNIDTVLFVGGIDFRNQVFQELGFSLTDLDKKV